MLIALPYAIWQKRFRELLGTVWSPYRGDRRERAVGVGVHLQSRLLELLLWHEHIQRFAATMPSTPSRLVIPAAAGCVQPAVGRPVAVHPETSVDGSAARKSLVLLWLLMPGVLQLAKGKLPSTSCRACCRWLC